MKSLKNVTTKTIKSIVNMNLKSAANSTTCVFAYQPTAPEKLKKFSKVDNDK